MAIGDVLVVPSASGLDLEDFEEQVELDGTLFILRFRWNAREGAWFLDVLDSAETPLVMGRRLVADGVLLARARHLQGVPAGELMPYDTEQRQEDPAFDDLGTRVLLAYQNATDA